uniref:Uncharacterized protein n=1 Tax=Hyaloperonospora arabidopsidis (strain Emoy2) TaxID=559515 RepID=M4B3K0_HYAAE
MAVQISLSCSFHPCTLGCRVLSMKSLESRLHSLRRRTRSRSSVPTACTA